MIEEKTNSFAVPRVHIAVCAFVTSWQRQKNTEWRCIVMSALMIFERVVICIFSCYLLSYDKTRIERTRRPARSYFLGRIWMKCFPMIYRMLVREHTEKTLTPSCLSAFSNMTLHDFRTEAMYKTNAFNKLINCREVEPQSQQWTSRKMIFETKKRTKMIGCWMVSALDDTAPWKSIHHFCTVYVRTDRFLCSIFNSCRDFFFQFIN